MTIEIRKIPFKDIEKCGVSLKDKDNTYSLKKHAEENDWDIAVNGAMFSNGRKGSDPYFYWNITDMVIDGVLNRGGNYSDKGIAFGNPWSGVGAYFTTTENCKGKPVDFIGGAPTLLIDGVINMDMKGLGKSFATNYTQRRAIGIDKYNLYICSTGKTKATLNQVAQALKDKGCLNAINLDGGGSGADYEKGKSYFTQGRNITSAVGLKLKSVKKKIILDAGHSPLVSGKQSPDGTYKEFEFNLDIVNRMKKTLARYPLEVVIVDFSHASATTELNTLIDKINDETADICVSIHSNAYGTDFNSANGWEAFYYDDPEYPEGRQLAEKIHAKVPILGLTDRGIKPGNHLALVRETDMPCVLIETAFHTNLSDLEKLKDSTFRDLVAKTYCQGILDYFGIEWVEPTNVTKPDTVTIYRVIEQHASFTNKAAAEKMMLQLKNEGKFVYIKEETK